MVNRPGGWVTWRVPSEKMFIHGPACPAVRRFASLLVAGLSRSPSTTLVRRPLVQGLDPRVMVRQVLALITAETFPARERGAGRWPWFGVRMGLAVPCRPAPILGGPCPAAADVLGLGWRAVFPVTPVGPAGRAWAAARASVVAAPRAPGRRQAPPWTRRGAPGPSLVAALGRWLPPDPGPGHGLAARAWAPPALAACPLPV